MPVCASSVVGDFAAYQVLWDALLFKNFFKIPLDKLQLEVYYNSQQTEEKE